MTLLDFVEKYANFRDIRQSTIDQYVWSIKSLNAHLKRQATLDDLKPDIVNAWLRSIGHHLSPFTVKSKRNQVVSLWRAAFEMGLAQSPSLVRRVKTPDRKLRVLTSAECELLVAEANRTPGAVENYLRGPYLATLIQATLESSLRQSDLHLLEWPDIREGRGTLVIVQKKTSRRRVVRFSPTLLERIDRWHGPHGLIWPRSNRHLVNKMLKAAARRAGIGEITHTMLRRTAIHAVEKLEPGRGWLFAGHASDATTRTWYLPAEIEYHSLPMPQLV